MRYIKLISILIMMFLTAHSYGQSSLKKYNHLINESQSQLTKTIEAERGRKRTERIEKGRDSVRLVLRRKSPRETFTFFITDDTLRYIGITFFKATMLELENLLSTQFELKPLENLKGEIFENYTNDKHIARKLFWDNQSEVSYLLVTYPELPDRYSNVVIWKGK